MATATSPVKEESRSASDDGRDCGKWTKEEDILLKTAVDNIGARNWKRISTEYLGGKRSDVQCLHRWQKVLKPGLIKGPWTKEEDDTIMEAIKSGVTKWSEIATLIPGRIGKQCRERWFNHLDPSIKKGGWTEEEDRILVEYQEKLGNRWCEIAKVLPGRSENAVKNRWNSAMRRKYQQKRSKQGTPVPVIKAPTPIQAAVAAAKTPQKLSRNNVRLPPEVILVEQPSNRNSVIAAREKIRRYQEQKVDISQSFGSASHSSGPLQPAAKTSSSTTGLLAKLQQQQQLKQMQRKKGEDADKRKGEQGKLPIENGGTASLANHQLGASTPPPPPPPPPALAQDKSAAKAGRKTKAMAVARDLAGGENCGSHGNTNVINKTATATHKRPLGKLLAEVAKEGAAAKNTKKRQKRSGSRLSKAVNNLLDPDTFKAELSKRKQFTEHQLSETDATNLHDRLLSIIDEALASQTNLSVSMVWARLTDFIKKGGLQGSAESFQGSDDGAPRSMSKGKPRDLRVQCSLDPSTWTMSGGTPTVFGGNGTTPIGEMLNMIPGFHGINPSIFSPTPRHGGQMLGCPTPLHHSFPTPTAAEIKKIDQLDDPLFPDSMFFQLDSSTLASLNAALPGSSVLSPIFRQPSQADQST